MPSMSSRAIVVVMFVLAMMTCATASATIEHCLRLQLNPPPPPPRHAAPGFRSSLDLSSIVCRDMFRAVVYSLRSTGKLPFSYLAALCNIFGDNDQEVQRYITHTFRPYDFHKLIAGRSCATIRKKQHPMPPSSLSRL